jgi:hypothetical protein
LFDGRDDKTEAVQRAGKGLLVVGEAYRGRRGVGNLLQFIGGAGGNGFEYISGFIGGSGKNHSIRFESFVAGCDDPKFLILLVDESNHRGLKADTHRR